MYYYRLLVLLISREITMLTAKYAVTHKPVVVMGRKGGHVVDDSFNMGQH